MLPNLSERFESRWSAVSIFNSPAIMLHGMDGSVLGIHVDHGEGRFHFPDQEVLTQILEGNLAPIRYMRGPHVTMDYPHNPNGSEQGIAGLCDPTGRHLFMMPHPERTWLRSLWHHWPETWEYEQSPWLRMFQNARIWLEQN